MSADNERDERREAQERERDEADDVRQHSLASQHWTTEDALTWVEFVSMEQERWSR